MKKLAPSKSHTIIRRKNRKFSGQQVYVGIFILVSAIMTVYAFLSLGFLQSAKSNVGPVTQTLTQTIKRYSDDGEENIVTKKVDLTNAELHLGTSAQIPTLVGLRFAGVTIPKGSIINSAHIEFIASQSNSEPTNLLLYGHDHESSTTFRNREKNISDRPKTTGITWNVTENWNSGDVKKSPDITTLVQYIVNKSAWRSGNALAILIEGNGSRISRSFKGNNTFAPKLFITYTQPGFSTPTPQNTTTPATTPRPTPIPTQIFLPTPTPMSGVPVNPAGQLFITTSELFSKPTSGTGWNFLKSIADMSSYGHANLSDQNLKTQTHTLAGALVYARTGNAMYRDKVIATIRQVCGTENENLLGLARTLYGYVVSADLVRMDYSTTCTNGQTWQNFLETIRTKSVGSHSRWKTLEFTSGNTAGNWGNYALPTHLAVSYALGDTGAIQRDLNIFKRILGDTTSPARPFQPTAGYWYPNSSFTVTTQSNGFTWDMSQSNSNISQSVLRGINPYSATDMRSGAIIEDTLRGDPNSVPCCTVTSSGIGYQAESLDGTFSTMQLFLANGIDLRAFQDSALRRAFEFYMNHGGPAPATQQRYLPYFVNYYYNTQHVTSGDGVHRHMGYGSWLFTL